MVVSASSGLPSVTTGVCFRQLRAQREEQRICMVISHPVTKQDSASHKSSGQQMEQLMTYASLLASGCLLHREYQLFYHYDYGKIIYLILEGDWSPITTIPVSGFGVEYNHAYQTPS
nr:hypothetical protein CFP56_79463 [Quercus suber]